MAVTLTYELDLGQLRGAGDRLAAAATDMTPLMDAIGALLEQSARDRIEDTNTAPDGTPWPKSLRVEMNQGGKTLLDSGRLAASLTHIASRDQAEIGSNLIYAGVHQQGAEIRPTSGNALRFQLPDGRFVTVGKVTIPARPYLGASEEDEAEIRELTADYFGGAWGDL
ncbi:phage virion morphogenesis protein [Tropicimonas sp. S265A]|uniref:phage virion morphogenesis protein n=1 Tax=Tropicimonas sp. S265A TaxID=3415134 RepID=UPI003C7D0E62